MHEEFIGQTKEQIRSLFDRVKKLEYSNESLKEITTILKLQQEQNAEHLRSFEKINENLTNLNSTVKALQVDMDNVKEEVSDLKESGKFDIRKFSKEFLYKVMPSIIGGFILAGLTYWLFSK